MYVASGNDDVVALDQSVSTMCCGRDNRGVAVGGGFVYSGGLDGSFMALDQTTGQLEWQTQVGAWQDGYTFTAVPLYYNGVVYTGLSGGDLGVRGGPRHAVVRAESSSPRSRPRQDIVSPRSGPPRER
jgi:alcohol dehydrogenase (cytochrome c)